MLLTHRPFTLSNDIAGAVMYQCKSVFKGEACGVILDNGDVVALENKSADLESEFEMGAEFEGYRSRAIAIYHSHISPDIPAELSSADISNSKEMNIPYLCYHTIFGQWDYFDPLALHPFPMEMDAMQSPRQLDYYNLWRFVYGRSDCFSLVRAYYAGMLQIPLRDYGRVDLDTCNELGLNQFTPSRVRVQGFRQLSKETPIQDHDVLLINLGTPEPGHLAIVCSAEGNQVLHNLGEGRYSMVESLDTSLRNATVWMYRHVSLCDPAII
jgi:proteasome lid subunit RPN8/RPN11